MSLKIRAPGRAGTDAPSWLIVLAMAGSTLLVQPQEPLTLLPAGVVLPGAGVAVLTLLMLFACRAGMPRLQASATAFLQMTVFTLLALVLSYAIAAQGGALWDDRLAAWDRSLGLDWPALRAGLDRMPLLTWATGLAYHSLIPQMILVIVALGALGRFEALRVTTCAAIIAGFATVLLSGLFPAMGNLFDPAGYRNLWPPIAWLHADTIAGLRDGSLRVLDLREMMGIVTFPSYHAALAAIFIWAFRHAGALRLLGGGWALLTILATPIGGGHYMVDVLAGLLLALVSLRLAQRLVLLPSALRGSSRRFAPPVLQPGSCGIRSQAAPAAACQGDRAFRLTRDKFDKFGVFR